MRHKGDEIWLGWGQGDSMRSNKTNGKVPSQPLVIQGGRDSWGSSYVHVSVPIVFVSDSFASNSTVCGNKGEKGKKVPLMKGGDKTIWLSPQPIQLQSHLYQIASKFLNAFRPTKEVRISPETRSVFCQGPQTYTMGPATSTDSIF